MPSEPCIDHYVQCLTELDAHPDFEANLLIYYTPTCMAFYLIFKVAPLWRMLKFTAAKNAKYCAKVNMARFIKKVAPERERDHDDQKRVYEAIRRLWVWERVLLWEKDLGLQTTDYFPVDVQTIQAIDLIKPLQT